MPESRLLPVANPAPAPPEPVAPGMGPAGSPPAMAQEEVGLMAPNYPLPRLALASGRGSWVVGTDGRRYLDFVSGIAVNALGHAPPGVASAVARQMRALVHCSNLYANAPGTRLASDLAAATGYPRVFFCNSGTEGVEAALKFARVWAHARGRAAAGTVLAFRGGFHGRTGFALSVTWTPAYREPFEPLVPGVRFAEFNGLEGLDQALDAAVETVVVEPVQGEGGAVPASRAFLEALRARCTALGAALIFDEVQCGMGRCGRLLASEHYGVRGDLVVLSKALGGGLPLGAVLLTDEVAKALAPGMHGCTFGGGPVVTAAGSWVLGRVRRPGFLARVRSRGRALLAGLEDVAGRHPTLGEARGLGLLCAVDLSAAASYEPPALVAAARERGLLLVRGGERAVRFLPPLNVSPEEIALALERFEAAVIQLEEKGS
jgi:acetylornithine/N-succinyldiaminopimelate aminotransferase